MKEALIHQAYEIAKERYAALGIDTEKVLEQLQNFHLSMHCWQADDVKGFEVQAGALTGGIQSTGNYPGAARNIDELRADVLKAKSLIPGNHRLNLHEIYGDFQGKVVDRDEVTVDYFQSWIEWAKEHDTKLDFNSTSFSHPKSGNLSLANPDESIRAFWVEHSKRCRDIADEIKKRGFKKVLLVTDKPLIQFGVAAKIEEVLKNADIPYEIYSEIKPNPTIKNVLDGLAVAAFNDVCTGGNPRPTSVEDIEKLYNIAF